MTVEALGPYFGNMPAEMAVVVFEWLDPISLGNCLGVNKQVQKIATECLTKWFRSHADKQLFTTYSIQVYEQAVSNYRQIERYERLAQKYNLITDEFVKLSYCIKNFSKTVSVWSALVKFAGINAGGSIPEPVCFEKTESNLLYTSTISAAVLLTHAAVKETQNNVDLQKLQHNYFIAEAYAVIINSGQLQLLENLERLGFTSLSMQPACYSVPSGEDSV